MPPPSMARIQDLSNELVIGILEHVSPDDIESVSLASKRIYQLAIPRLEEHRMLRKPLSKLLRGTRNLKTFA